MADQADHKYYNETSAVLYDAVVRLSRMRKLTHPEAVTALFDVASMVLAESFHLGLWTDTPQEVVDVYLGGYAEHIEQRIEELKSRSATVH